MRLTLDKRTVFVSTGSAQATAQSKVPTPAIVFLHGAGFDHTLWVMPIRYFARQGMRVLAPDFPGHGRSEGPPLTTIEEMADWVARLMDCIGIQSAAMVGHSMGALVAYAFATRHTQRCSSLSLLAPSLPMTVTNLLLEAAADDDHAAIDMANTWSHSHQARIGGNQNPGIWMLGAGARLIERMAPGVYHADFAACNAYVPAPPEFDVPTLVVVGSADQMTPAQRGRALAASLRQARVVLLPGCGHSMLAEAPNAVLDALISHIRTTSEPGG